MTRTPLPKSGCFTSSYPSTEWREVPCTTPLPRPYPARGPKPLTVGNGAGFSANSATGHISLAVGSFDRVTGVIRETGSATGAPNTFSLQLNANFFQTPACNGAVNPAQCQGWQQFVFSTNGCVNNRTCAFMQYWLIGFGPNCPATGGGITGWMKPPPPFQNDCFANSNAVPVPPQTIAGLAQFNLAGAAANGGSDTLFMSAGNPVVINAVNGPDNIVDLAQGWQQAEFNIFGDCCSIEANFNPGSTLVVRISVDQGASTAPGCVQAGFTGETNNLTLVSAPAAVAATPLPAVVFTESNLPGAPPTCPAVAAATPPPTIPVFRCVRATSNLNGAYGVGMLITHPEFCSTQGPAINPAAVPAFVATRIPGLIAAGLPIFVCNQFSPNLGASYGIGEVTTDPQFCWNGGPAGATVPPAAVPPAVATATGLMAGTQPIFRCNHAAPRAPYGIGVLTTHPQFCSLNGQIFPPRTVPASVALDTGLRVR